MAEWVVDGDNVVGSRPRRMVAWSRRRQAAAGRAPGALPGGPRRAG